MIKKMLVGLLIALAATTLGLVTYSFFISSGNPDRSRFILRERQGLFFRSGQELVAEEGPFVGFLAPSFRLKTPQGDELALEDLRGRPVILNFWASWCPPCVAELPALEEFHKEYGDRVELLGINWGESPKAVSSFLWRYAVNYTNLLDPDGRVFVSYLLTGVPTTFFVDEAGYIKGVWRGPLETEELVQILEELELLKGASP